jgi:hypothetical protein
MPRAWADRTVGVEAEGGPITDILTGADTTIVRRRGQDMIVDENYATIAAF